MIRQTLHQLREAGEFRRRCRHFEGGVVGLAHCRLGSSECRVWGLKGEKVRLGMERRKVCSDRLWQRSCEEGATVSFSQLFLGRLPEFWEGRRSIWKFRAITEPSKHIIFSVESISNPIKHLMIHHRSHPPLNGMVATNHHAVVSTCTLPSCTSRCRRLAHGVVRGLYRRPAE